MARFFYFIGRAFRHMRRNPFVVGVTVGTITIVFLVLGVFALLGHNLDRLAQKLQAGLEISVYFDDETDEAKQQQVLVHLQRSPLVERAVLVPRHQALTDFRQRLGAQATLLDELDENPLPATIRATLSPQGRNSQAMSSLAQDVVAMGGVEQVQYGQAWLDRFFSFARLARITGLVIGVLIVFATLMIVANTIRLSLFARRDEIHILQLVGATDRFVKAPFYIEGAFMGALGAGLGVTLTFLLYLLIAPHVRIPLGPMGGELELTFVSRLGTALMVGAGFGLGVLGTLASLWRHLRI